MPAPVDDDLTEEALEAGGLRYTTDEAPGIRRVRRGRGFSYLTPDGRTVTSPRVRARLDDLVIPPAWQDVWISTDPRGHLQATGRDQRGRKVYRYHPRWRAVRDAAKYEHLLDFAESLGDIRRAVDEDLRRPTVDVQRVSALAVRLLDETLVRVGNEEYARENGSFGLTTLRRRHAKVDGGRVVFEFPGKSGVDHEVEVRDARLVRAVRRCHELSGKRLFSYVDDDERVQDLTSADVNEYLRERSTPDVSAKDFRTWGGTVEAVRTFMTSDAEEPVAVNDAIDAAAERLGNTRTVCRSCYLHPRVLEAHAEGSLGEAWAGARSSRWYDRAERAVLALLRSSDVAEAA